MSLMYVTPDKIKSKTNSGKRKAKKLYRTVISHGELHAMIKVAENLTSVRSNGSSDPFVKG